MRGVAASVRNRLASRSYAAVWSDWPSGCCGAGICKRQRVKRAVPFTVHVAEGVRMAPHSMVAVAARATVNDRLVLGRPILIDPVICR